MDKGEIIMIIGFIVTLVLFIWYVFGDSPTLEQLILGVSLINTGWIYTLSNKMERHLGEHEGYKKAKENQTPKPT